MEDIAKRLDVFIKKTLSEKAKEMQMINFRLEKILRKSWEKPSSFTQQDWDTAVELVIKLNSLCS